MYSVIDRESFEKLGDFLERLARVKYYQYPIPPLSINLEDELFGI